MFLGLPQLEAARRKIALGDEPQFSTYDWVIETKQSLIQREPVWDVYSDAADPSQGCDPEGANGCVMAAGFGGEDGREHTDRSKRNMSFQINSAYVNALLFYYSGGDEKYAHNAIRMLNAYARTFKGFVSSPANSYAGDLFAAWMAQTLVRAAEIIRYTYSPAEGEPALDVKAFEKMLETAFVPRLEDGTANVNNWRTSAAEGLMNIGVFLDDRRLYERSLEIWRGVTTAYIYLKSDGNRPTSLFDWTDEQLDCRWADNRAEACKVHPKKSPGLIYQNGQNQEICRDMWHSSAGVGGIINAAETAYLQGDDLYWVEKSRLMTGLSYMIQLSQSVESHGPPANFCATEGMAQSTGKAGALPDDWDSTEPLPVVVAQNHYSGRLGIPFTAIAIPGYPRGQETQDPIARYVEEHRSGPRDTFGYVTAWQVLTHSGVGRGIAPSALPLRPSEPSSSVAPSQTDETVPSTTSVLVLAAGAGGVLVLVVLASRAARRLWSRSKPCE